MGPMQSAVVVLLLLVVHGIAGQDPDEQNQKGKLFYALANLIHVLLTETLWFCPVLATCLSRKKNPLFFVVNLTIISSVCLPSLTLAKV